VSLQWRCGQTHVAAARICVIDLLCSGLRAAQGRHQDAALAAVAAATPNLSIGLIKKTGLGRQRPAARRQVGR
jgi:hypothetical protein